jgi:hypothetical protein
MTQQKPAADFRDLIVWQKAQLLCADLGYLEKDADAGQGNGVSRMPGAYTRTLLTPTS